jgi:hypothetical protein
MLNTCYLTDFICIQHVQVQKAIDDGWSYKREAGYACELLIQPKLSMASGKGQYWLKGVKKTSRSRYVKTLRGTQ